VKLRGQATSPSDWLEDTKAGWLGEACPTEFPLGHAAGQFYRWVKSAHITFTVLPIPWPFVKRVNERPVRSLLAVAASH